MDTSIEAYRASGSSKSYRQWRAERTSQDEKTSAQKAVEDVESTSTYARTKRR